MAREATKAELLAVLEAEGQPVTEDALAEAIRAIRHVQRDKCFWGRVEIKS